MDARTFAERREHGIEPEAYYVRALEKAQVGFNRSFSSRDDAESYILAHADTAPPCVVELGKPWGKRVVTRAQLFRRAGRSLPGSG